MKFEILAELYHRFYVPQERSAEKTEIETCHAELSKTLDRSERRLLLVRVGVKTPKNVGGKSPKWVGIT